MINLGKMQIRTLLSLVLVVLGAFLLLGGLIWRGLGQEPANQDALPFSTPLIFQEATAESGAPAARPTTAYVSAIDTLSVAFSGEYGNGGIWAWADIINLMGIYSTPDTLVPVTHDGQRYEGVPIAYLLHYAETNSYADMIVIKGQGNTVHAYPVSVLQNCGNCIVAATAQNNLVAVLPGLEPRFIDGVSRLDAATADVAASEVAAAIEAERMANNPSIRVSGDIEGPTAWTWEDIANLLGVYGSPGNFQQHTVNGVTYEGVPLSYLLHYVQMESRANTLRASLNGGLQQIYRFNQLDDLVNYLVALAPDGSFVLLAPSEQGIAVLPDLFRLNVQYSAQDVIPGDPQVINLNGSFQQGGAWTWSDIVNLLGVFAETSDLKTAQIGGTTYSGVPLIHLLNYARILNSQPDQLIIYNRNGLRQNMQLTPLLSCLECLIVSENNGTLTLVMPGQSPELFPELAAIEIP